jgi:hypothetical protein
VDTKELEALNLLHYSPVDDNGGVFNPLSVVDNAIEGVAIAIPSIDAAGQNALIGTAVELFEDLRAHAKPFQPLSRLLHGRVRVCGLEVDMREVMESTLGQDKQVTGMGSIGIVILLEICNVRSIKKYVCRLGLIS